MGAVANMRPELFRAVVAEVPFVDVVTTMSDESLPLTVTEWEEWGNPRDDPEAYAYMKSYSPYDNVQPGDYPSMYVTAGLNDPRVGLLGAGQMGGQAAGDQDRRQPVAAEDRNGRRPPRPSGRYDAWRDEARVQAFILAAVGYQATEGTSRCQRRPRHRSSRPGRGRSGHRPRTTRPGPRAAGGGTQL